MSTLPANPPDSLQRMFIRRWITAALPIARKPGSMAGERGDFQNKSRRPMPSRLTCVSCGHRPYSPPAYYGEVRRIRSVSGRVLVTFWCLECWPEKILKPLQGMEAELALHCWLRRPVSDMAAGLAMDEPERKAIYANTLKPLNHDDE